MLPMVVALLAAFGAAWAQRRLRPDLAAWTLTILAGGSALAVVWAVLVLAAGWAVEQPGLSGLFGWCSMLFSSHDRVPTAAGIAAWATLVGMVLSLSWRLRERRNAHRAGYDHVASSTEPIAFAVPGRPGRVIVSAGMLDLLDDAEQQVLYAHEQSHLRHRHHRFLAVAEAAAAAVPLLRPVCQQVRFATERWADEDAADEVGDRRLVARAVGRAALAASADGAPRPAMSVVGSGTRARVEALIEPASPAGPRAAGWLAVGTAGFLVSLASSTLQLHHLVAFLAHVCGFD